jgi:hypothetical protein
MSTGAFWSLVVTAGNVTYCGRVAILAGLRGP